MAPVRLEHFELFRDLDTADRSVLERAAVRRTMAKREVIFAPGTPAEWIFAVIAGKVKIYRISGEGKQQVLGVFGPGQVFAEAAVFEEATYPAWAEAIEAGRLVAVPADAIIRRIEASPKLALRMLAAMSRRMRHLARLAESLSLTNVEERARHYFTDLYYRSGVPLVQGARARLDTDKGTLAARLGMTPETLSRLFRRLREQGILEVRNRDVTLLSPGLLNRSRDLGDPPA